VRRWWLLTAFALAGCGGGLQVVQRQTRSEPQWQVTRQPMQGQQQEPPPANPLPPKPVADPQPPAQPSPQ
jgi:hypothetical protein